MNEISLSQDKKIASIGPGNRWGAVYKKLAEYGLVVIGGRASDVGLGLVLGGGISHHSNIYGFACESVIPPRDKKRFFANAIQQRRLLRSRYRVRNHTERLSHLVSGSLLGFARRRKQFWCCHEIQPGDETTSHAHLGWYASSHDARLPSLDQCVRHTSRERSRRSQGRSDPLFCCNCLVGLPHSFSWNTSSP
jgi:hypothetical protein